MPLPRLRADPDATLEAGFARIREQLEVPERFAAPVLAEAEAAAEQGPSDLNRVDRTDLALVTIDPPGSRDLDQAYHAESAGSGWTVHYAIADVGAFVTPGSRVDIEAWDRGLTMYSPDHRAGLHPEVLSEDAASLLAGQRRPAVLWTMEVDGDGTMGEVDVVRAWVSSRAQLTYAEVQAAVDAGGAQAPLDVLPHLGAARRAHLEEQGGISLNLPDQEIRAEPEEGGYRLRYDEPLPVERWNEQLSLMTGMAAARLMLDAGVGIVRTLPPADPSTVRQLGYSARALGVAWPESGAASDYGGVLGRLDASVPGHAALITQAARLFRGAGYEAFDGDAPSDPEHHAIGGPYAHVTAPLRRLVDRHANEVALAVVAGRRPPDWVLAGFEDMASTMGGAKARQGRLDRAMVDFVEAVVLSGRVGEEFDVVVTAVDDDGDATVQMRAPAVMARVPKAGLTAGTEARLRLEAVDQEAGTVEFSVVEPGP